MKNHYSKDVIVTVLKKRPIDTILLLGSGNRSKWSQRWDRLLMWISRKFVLLINKISENKGFKEQGVNSNNEQSVFIFSMVAEGKPIQRG